MACYLRKAGWSSNDRLLLFAVELTDRGSAEVAVVPRSASKMLLLVLGTLTRNKVYNLPSVTICAVGLGFDYRLSMMFVMCLGVLVYIRKTIYKYSISISHTDRIPMVQTLLSLFVAR